MSKYYFLTFGTYCSRVPGDERGAYRNDGSPVPPNPILHFHVKQAARFPEVSFSYEERRISFAAMVKRCAKRKWKLGALNVRKQHTHALICTPNDDPPETVATGLKTLASHWLRRGKAALDPPPPIWERGYNVRRVYDFIEWSRIAKYILLEQHGNDYLSETQWRKYSEKWVANPFGENSRYRGLTFDGKTLRYLIDETKQIDFTFDSRPKTPFDVPDWNS